MRGPLTAGRFACPAGFGARGLCAGRPPPDAALARPAIRGFPAAIAAGRGQAAAAPLLRPSARLTRGGSSDPSPYVIPTSAWRDRIGRTPVRSVVNRQAAPAPGLGPWDRGGPPLSREARRVALPRLVRARSAAIAALRKATRRRRRHSVRRRCDPRTGHARPGRSRLKFFGTPFFQKRCAGNCRF